jgi:hypothetical protein
MLLCYSSVGNEVSKIGRVAIGYNHPVNANLLVVFIPD